MKHLEYNGNFESSPIISRKKVEFWYLLKQYLTAYRFDSNKTSLQGFVIEPNSLHIQIVIVID